VAKTDLRYDLESGCCVVPHLGQRSLSASSNLKTGRQE
jgi:hypothetical protein